MADHEHRLSRRTFIRRSAAGLGYLAFSSCGLGRLGPLRRPNIVYIIADDMGFGDPGCFNPDSKIPTPHMDRLALEGMRFTDAHSGSAVCTPTRYGILTGRYAWRSRLKAHVLWGYSPPLIEPGRMTVASLLGDQGYHTGCVGKWHLGLGWATTDGVTPQTG
jgi:arylsulfatase A-like enzyme